MPRSPAAPCRYAGQGCAELRPCPVHPDPAAWSRRSPRTRRRTLSGSQEQARARRVIARGRGVCHVCRHAGADEADHVIAVADGGADTEANMAPIHGGRCSTCGRRCHADKTQEEARRARARRGRRGEG